MRNSVNEDLDECEQDEECWLDLCTSKVENTGSSRMPIARRNLLHCSHMEARNWEINATFWRGDLGAKLAADFRVLGRSSGKLMDVIDVKTSDEDDFCPTP